MIRSIRRTASPANHKQMDFIQAILGKYGITRWRSRFQSLILRQYPLLFAEPEAVKPAETVINNIHPVKEMHIHHSIYPPITQVMTGPGTVNRVLYTTQGSGGAGIGSPASSPGHQNLIHGLQERVWKQQHAERPVTRGYRTLDPAGSAVEPVTVQVAMRNQERTDGTPLSYLLPMPAAAPAGTDLAGRRIGSRLEPYSGDSRQGQSLAGRGPQHLPAAHGQLQTLRTYILHQSVDTVNNEQPLRQKLEPAAVRHDQAEPPRMALSHPGAGSGSAGTTVEAQHSTPSVRPSPGPRSLVSPNLHLGLGQRLAAALDKLEGRSERLNPLPAGPAAVHDGLQQPDVLPLQLLAVPSEPRSMVQRHSSARLSSAVRPAHIGGLLSVAPQNGLIHTAKGQAVPLALKGRGPGGRLITAGPEQEEYLQPAGRYSSLILRKPAAPKAARPEPVQQWPEPVPQERAAPPTSQSFPKAAAPAAKMDTAELNQLAERVYQVLEKKMAIRKDRRGLR
ncbi:hypothetical protein [Paenibacillus riograndensis]|uniref:Uncharacterized protein n=2 Tax=Paenibacillus riograndensis TaxID=483937 RepID=A0A0E4HBN8_9BACL|nr:hypothetical protein [Paenibacillus riograndensis]CQR56677.1 hypothetical protein PRIO_4275 [Paenibacillus riograndensis SBR5]